VQQHFVNYCQLLYPVMLVWQPEQYYHLNIQIKFKSNVFSCAGRWCLLWVITLPPLPLHGTGC